MDEGKLSLESKNIAAEKRQELLRLFPEAQTEGGKIDFDQLKRALGESVDAGRERYGMNWPGKADCFRLIQSPSTATLLPMRGESVRFDDTENLIIEGDNLEVLKLLQKGYQNKVKMIYIDPPYNTGNDFIYPDDFTDNLKNYLQYTGQSDSEGKRFTNNLESDGRFHSKWLNMMYPRLYLARNLLSDDGAIFVSIDDHELVNARRALDEVFGPEAFVSQIAVVNNLKGRNDRKNIATAHEHLLFYAMPLFESEGLPLTEAQLAAYKEKGDDGVLFQWGDLRKRGGADTRSARPNLYFPLYADPVSGAVSMKMTGVFKQEIYPMKSDGTEGCWRWGKIKVADHIAQLKASKVEGKNRWNVAYRVHLSKDGEERSSTPKSFWQGSEFSTDSATKALSGLLGSAQALTPKPVGLMRQLVQLTANDSDLVLDLFGGSGTTAQAVNELSFEDRVICKYILIQLPEPTNSEAYRTIADITKERVRRVIQRQEKLEEGKLDLQHEAHSGTKEGFRVFKLAPSNFKVWDAHTDQGVSGLEHQMELAVSHIMPDRTAEDIFYEILMKSEYPLTAKVENFDAAGIPIFSVEDDSLIVCVERKVTAEAIAAIAKRSPSKVIFLDEAFSGNDQLKANAKMNFESAGVKRFETV